MTQKVITTTNESGQATSGPSLALLCSLDNKTQYTSSSWAENSDGYQEEGWP